VAKQWITIAIIPPIPYIKHMKTSPKVTKRPSGYLKANSKKVLDIIATQKKKNATEAYRQVYGDVAPITARANAYQLLQKPSAQIYLQTHIDNARQTVVDLLKSEKDDIRLRSAQDILDREHGKATQRIEQQTTGVTLTIDLTSALSEEQA
jgi:hypothetical protein